MFVFFSAAYPSINPFFSLLESANQGFLKLSSNRCGHQKAAIFTFSVYMGHIIGLLNDWRWIGRNIRTFLSFDYVTFGDNLSQKSMYHRGLLILSEKKRNKLQSRWWIPIFERRHDKLVSMTEYTNLVTSKYKSTISFKSKDIIRHLS